MSVHGLPESRAPFQRANALSAAILRRRGAVLGFSLIAIPAIALLDLATGYELALSILYLGPVVASTWSFGLRAGVAVSLLATAAWVGTDVFAEHRYSLAIYRFWEGFIRLVTFVLFAFVVDRLKRALARSDDRLIKVLEGLDAAICVIDPLTGAILYRNRPFDTAFPAATRDEAAGRLLENAAAREAGVNAGEELRLGERWFLVRGRWVTWTDERSVLLLSATDVTSRREAEALNREQEAKLQATARLVAVGEIASSIAHELNQPLAAITNYVRGGLRRLRAGGAEPEALAGALEQAGEQAERAGQIIRRVRDFVNSRQPVLATLDLNALVAQAAAAATPDATRQGARLALHLAPALPPARADAVMIEQVILNLVRNAVEASATVAGGNRQVDIHTARGEPGVLEVTVADRGPGISGEAAGRLFEPFYTSKPEGMGLGLNICRSIVEFHGGRLAAGPREGGGAEFRFSVRAAEGGE
jgi:signal transduction histidine kinase